jgi:hypothetical protein
MVGIRRVFGLCAAAGLIVVSWSEREAQACGGCFVPPTETVSVVTDHRMAFQISTQQTVLWDQIRYSGDPKEFAWVLPVRPGTVIEASTDAWFATLDALTAPQITAPAGRGSSGAGCGSNKASFAASDGGSDDGVTVISQSVVGPYETATLRSSDPNALDTWLTQNGYAIPPSIRPTIAAYVSEKFDFIALKLRPGQGVRAMRPVRVVFQGSDNSLPLRMVAAGVGAQVGITLYVIGEGRYHPQNFPDATWNEGALVWDSAQGRSNYSELTLAAMAQQNGRAWLTEYAQHINLQSLDSFYVSGRFGAPSGYTGLCKNELGIMDPDGGLLPQDGSASDASDASDTDGSDASDAAAADSGTDNDAGPTPQNACDDLIVASRYLHASDTWITRLRGNLPAAALADDLKLEASASQIAVSNIHTAQAAPGDALTRGSSCATAPIDDGTGMEVGGCLVALAAILRRRKV